MPNPVLSEVAATIRAGEPVYIASLVRLLFTSETVRLWDGIGPITVGGETWLGAGDLLGVSDIATTRGGTAGNFTVRLANLDVSVGPLAGQQEAEWRYRTVQALRLYRRDGGGIIGTQVMRTGTMQTLKRSRDSAETATLEVVCEDLFTDRRRPRWAYLSDQDQRRRYPGDKGMEFQPITVQKELTWPIL